MKEVDYETKTEKEKTKDNKENTKKFTMRELIWVLIGLVAGLLLGITVFYTTLSSALDDFGSSVESTETTEEEEETSSSEVTGITTYEYDSTVLTGDDADKAKNDILEYVTNISNNNCYTQVLTGEDEYMCYIYNKNGEVYIEDSNGTYSEVMLNNGVDISFDGSENSISTGENIDILQIVENAANAIGTDGVTLYDMDLSYIEGVETKEGDHEYRIDLVGDEAFKALYSSATDDLAASVLDTLKTELVDWEPHVIITCFISEDIESSYLNYLYVIDNTEYINWIFEGFIEIGEWKLSDEWYTYDAEADTDGSKGVGLLEVVTSDISDLMQQYTGEVETELEETTEIENEGTDVTE